MVTLRVTGAPVQVFGVAFGTGKKGLTYDSIEEIFAGGLHNFLEDLQVTCRTIGAHVTQTYLYYAVSA